MRHRDNGGGGQQGRRGHAPQLSISDDNHHVTEAIGYMYEDEDNDTYDPRPEPAQQTYSHQQSYHQQHPYGASYDSRQAPQSQSHSYREPMSRKMSNEPEHAHGQGAVRPPADRNYSWERGEKGENGMSTSHGRSQRSSSDTATSSFPLNDIDYESSPAAVAQELSNLQALRRMSMDVAAAGDPDLPQLNGGPVIPALAPSPTSSEDDASRLFWVPARLHPELAPKEFKSFLDNKAEQIRRRSGEFTYESDGLRPAGSLGSNAALRRKKSMLSRQIDNSNGRAADGYQDGAERLERKRSKSQRKERLDPNLEELEALVTDPTKMQRLSLESAQLSAGSETPAADDMPILPAIGPGSSLRRSTRTTYRRGSQTKKTDGRMTFSKRMQEAEEKRKAAATAASSVVPEPQRPGSQPSSENQHEEPRPLTRVSTDPSGAGSARTTNFSRPARGSLSGETPQQSSRESSYQRRDQNQPQQQSQPEQHQRTPSQTQPWRSQISSHGRSTLQIPPEQQTVPKIVVQETAAPVEENKGRASTTPSAPPTAANVSTPSSHGRLPERTSSHQLPQQAAQSASTAHRPSSAASSLSDRTSARTGQPPRAKSPQTLDQMSAHPSPLPGNNNRTNDLSFIPTLTEDKKADNKVKKDRRDEPTRKSSWNWLLGKEESDKKKEEEMRKPKAKITKPPEKHDNTRLDVLQSSIDGGNRGRESVVLDRDSLKLEEERKKESARKSAGSDTKKEEKGLLSSIFGGKKKSGEAGKKYAGRALSPEPPPRQLKPDIDYNWTRFSILEERAIYRMAHMKLANPRRSLYSQVLLSNFMYSYLAKVQQMHPHMNLPTSAKQQAQQQQKAHQKQDQPDEFQQYQRYQEVS